MMSKKNKEIKAYSLIMAVLVVFGATMLYLQTPTEGKTPEISVEDIGDFEITRVTTPPIQKNYFFEGVLLNAEEYFELKKNEFGMMYDDAKEKAYLEAKHREMTRKGYFYDEETNKYVTQNLMKTTSIALAERDISNPSYFYLHAWNVIDYHPEIQAWKNKVEERTNQYLMETHVIETNPGFEGFIIKPRGEGMILVYENKLINFYDFRGVI